MTALWALAVYSLNCPCMQVLELVRRVCGPDALHWTTRLDVMDQMQNLEVYTNWVRSGLTREQFVQFVYRLRIKTLKGEERSLNQAARLALAASARRRQLEHALLTST